MYSKLSAADENIIYNFLITNTVSFILYIFGCHWPLPYIQRFNLFCYKAIKIILMNLMDVKNYAKLAMDPFTLLYFLVISLLNLNPPATKCYSNP